MPLADTLPQLHPAFNRAAWTAVDILNPAIALIDHQKYLGLLLAKDSEVQHDGTVLRGVRWIRLPLGLRRFSLRYLSRFLPGHLPHEWLFNEVFLTLAPNGMFVARIGQEPHHPLVLPNPSSCPYPLKPISAGQYHRLAKAQGRLLESQVNALFHRHLGLDGQRTTPATPQFPRGPLPWSLFTG